MDEAGWDPPPCADARPASAAARVIVAEDHTLLRRGLVMALDGTGGEFRVVAEAASAQEVVELGVRLRPDLVVIGSVRPRMDGAGTARRLRLETAEIRILLLAPAPPDPGSLARLHGVADGYVTRDIDADELVDAARRLVMGKPYLQSSTIRQLLGASILDPGEQLAVTPTLTDRELDVLRLLATCRSNREIADHLVLGVETVRTHVRRILRKLSQPNRTRAVIAAAHIGLLDVTAVRPSGTAIADASPRRTESRVA